MVHSHVFVISEWTSWHSSNLVWNAKNHFKIQHVFTCKFLHFKTEEERLFSIVKYQDINYSNYNCDFTVSFQSKLWVAVSELQLTQNFTGLKLLGKTDSLLIASWAGRQSIPGLLYWNPGDKCSFSLLVLFFFLTHSTQEISITLGRTG